MAAQWATEPFCRQSFAITKVDLFIAATSEVGSVIFHFSFPSLIFHCRINALGLPTTIHWKELQEDEKWKMENEKLKMISPSGTIRLLISKAHPKIPGVTQYQTMELYLALKGPS